MLSRTADSLFWMGRYAERAGNLARGMQAALRMSGLRTRPGQAEEWRLLLVATGAEPGFAARHRDPSTEEAVAWLATSPDNPSSIAACIAAARRNARAVRTALTVDMWEALNDTWMEMRHRSAEGDDLAPFLDWVRTRTLLFNGASTDTMLRNDAWHFVQLGVMLERADNTARLLDAKHETLQEGGPTDAVDYLQWQSLLRSVSALRAYQVVYHSRLQPRLVAELLMLRPELPRSMLACHARVEALLDSIAQESGRRGPPHDIAAEVHARLRDARIEEVMAGGLHRFITQALDRNLDLGREISAFYLGS
jgi:uncharacterized alpha-E superfamily protein